MDCDIRWRTTLDLVPSSQASDQHHGAGNGLVVLACFSLSPGLCFDLSAPFTVNS